MNATSYHMTPDEFRKHGRDVVDWIADYWERVESIPVLSRAKPGDVRSKLPTSPPRTGDSIDAVLRDLDDVILPGITHWQSPNFFAYFPANASGPSVLGELLAAGLGVQGMLWSTSPACTELEAHVLDWLVEMLGLPDSFRSSSRGGGVIQDSASSAVLCALVAARERVEGPRTNADGCDGSLTAYASTQAHSSIEKAVRIAGLGDRNLRKIPVDESFAMRPDALRASLEADATSGKRPCFVCATVGTTSTNALDPLPEITRICKEHRVWLHVDAAMSGSAAICPEFRYIHEGLEGADSYCFNPHKWLFVNFDCDCFFVSDRDALTRALSILPEYLRNRASETGAVIDYRDWQIPLGRRFRALKLWLVVRYYGVEGLRYHVRRHVTMARLFCEWIHADDRFELSAPVPLNLVCFRHRGGDEVNNEILNRVNSSGELFLTHTKLNDLLVLRMSVGQTWTEERHVRRAWEKILEVTEEIEREINE